MAYDATVFEMKLWQYTKIHSTCHRLALHPFISTFSSILNLLKTSQPKPACGRLFISDSYSNHLQVLYKTTCGEEGEHTAKGSKGPSLGGYPLLEVP